MKRFALCLFIVFTAGTVQAQDRTGPDFSGVLDSTVNYTAGTGDAKKHSFGIEEYANIRLKLKTGEKAVFNAAFNLIAISGNYVEVAAVLGSLNQQLPFVSTPVIYGSNYAAALELERLYFRINGDSLDIEAGLLRMAFGYGNVWGSMDFLNPRNPLAENARPRGVLGANFSFYPADSFKLMFFAAAPGEPLQSDGGGFLPGVSMDKDWDKASIQALYAYKTPLTDSKLGLHRFGLSLKAEMEIGLVVDALYTLNPEKPEGIEGLSAGLGFDYSFFGGDLYILAEYLFNGSSSVTSWADLGIWRNHNYLSGNAVYRFNDYCTLSFSTIFCFDDLSFTPIAKLEYEVFQGFVLNLSAFLPLDQKTLSGGRTGELGPEERKVVCSINAGARLRF
ncbi:MAG: hypothetical protein LBH43_04775 [Treponema sp.]|jgi:hypothetical protein|nr:hypothetical protein [Treponema sp.]